MERAEALLEVPVVGAEHAPNLVRYLEQQGMVGRDAPADPEDAVARSKKAAPIKPSANPLHLFISFPPQGKARAGPLRQALLRNAYPDLPGNRILPCRQCMGLPLSCQRALREAHRSAWHSAGRAGSARGSRTRVPALPARIEQARIDGTGQQGLHSGAIRFRPGGKEV